MFDKFNQTLSFADPPEGGGGTKTKIGGVSGSSLTSTSTSDQTLPADPPEGGGGTETNTTTKKVATSSTSTD